MKIRRYFIIIIIIIILVCKSYIKKINGTFFLDTV